MRVLFTSLIAATVALIHVLDSPGLVSGSLAAARERTTQIINTKEVRITGLQRLRRSDIERSLPLQRSVGWWMMNSTNIIARVAENPWVSKAEIESCPGGFLPKFGCFVVAVRERSARFIASVDSERWVIGDDGALIVPASSSALPLSDEEMRHLIPLNGLVSRVQNPERSHAQLTLAQGAITVLERAVERSVTSVTFEGRGDLTVTFDRVPFPVTFGAPSDSMVVLEDQGRRFRALATQLRDRLGEIERVDLAFSKVGVVKFRVPAES
jgi:POTRA domain, FtsQ-type